MRLQEVKFAMNWMLLLLADNNVKSKVSSFVRLDNKIIFKSTLVTHLNGNPSLSKDRLPRLRKWVFYSCENANNFINGNGNLIGIGLDCIVFFIKEDVNSTRPKRKGISKEYQMNMFFGT